MSAVEDALDERVRELLAERFGPTTRLLRERALATKDMDVIERTKQARREALDSGSRRT